SIDEMRVENYVYLLRIEPGMVVTGAQRVDGKWHISGLRDPLAVDPATLLPKAKLDPADVVQHWAPYQALDPIIVLRGVEATLNPPLGVSLVVDGNTIRARGSAPQHWVEKARALIASLPAGAPKFDLSELKDVQDPRFIALRASIQAHIIKFDSGAPRP